MCFNNSYKKQGFTLIELMIVVAVVALLAALSYPSYTSYVQKAERKKASAEMMGIAGRLERIKSHTFRYPSTAPTNLTTADLRYSISVALVADGSTYTITADPSSFPAQAGDRCGTMTLDNTGAWTFASSLTESDCL